MSPSYFPIGSTQLQHVEQLHRQLWIRLPGEAIAIPADDALEHSASAGASGPDPPESLHLN